MHSTDYDPITINFDIIHIDLIYSTDCHPITIDFDFIYIQFI